MKFNDYFKDIPVLETDRLILRAFSTDDISDYIKIISDPNVKRFLGGAIDKLCNNLNSKSGEKHVTGWLKNINGRLLQSKTVFTWCIECKCVKKVIGRIDLGGFCNNSMANIAYHFSKDYWNKGFATEAVKEVSRFAFDDLLLHRIEATVLPENTGSIRVLEKNGYVKEGLLKKYLFGNEFHDIFIVAAIKEENLYKNE